MIKGSDLVLYLNNGTSLVPVCYAQNCQLNISADVLETTTFGSNNFKSYEYSTVGATLQHSGFTSFKNQTNTLQLIEAILNRQKIEFNFSEKGIIFSGTVLITSTDLDSQYDAASTFKANLLVDGKLTLTKLSTTTVLPLADWLGMPPEYCAYGTGSLFPIGLYNVNGAYLGSVNSTSELVALWNLSESNQVLGELSAGDNSCQYILTSPPNVDELPKWVHVDVANYVPPITGTEYLTVYYNDIHWSIVDDKWVYTDSRLIGLTGYAVYCSQVASFFHLEDGVDLQYDPINGGFTVLQEGWYLLPNPEFLLIFPNKYSTTLP